MAVDVLEKKVLQNYRALSKQYQDVAEVVRNPDNFHKFPGRGQRPTPVVDYENFLPSLKAWASTKGYL
jgi:hypothetical protein